MESTFKLSDHYSSAVVQPQHPSRNSVRGHLVGPRSPWSTGQLVLFSRRPYFDPRCAAALSCHVVGDPQNAVDAVARYVFILREDSHTTYTLKGDRVLLHFIEQMNKESEFEANIISNYSGVQARILGISFR